MKISNATSQPPELALYDAMMARAPAAKSALDAFRAAAEAAQSIMDRRKADPAALSATSAEILSGLLGQRDVFVCARRDSNFGPISALAPSVSMLRIHAAPRLS
ncbi:MAG: hypothetical protein LBT92_00785, partial [Rickettsiales bacterium]|nr:hypothetical protein [Rickettsiales bacterium]